MDLSPLYAWGDVMVALLYTIKESNLKVLLMFIHVEF